MENTHTVYFNMCHHYRKILNAKPRVDTCLPKTLQMKENSSRWKLDREDSFIRMKTPSQENQKERVVVNANTKQNNVPAVCPHYYQRHFRKEYENGRKPFAPTILKNNSAQSMARVPRIPQRKKRVQLALSDRSNSCQETEKRCKQRIKTVEDKVQVKPLKQTSVSSVNSYSEESSEDSAYNEGECNTDSRGSTPQNALNKQASKKQHLSIINNKLTPQNSSQVTRTKEEELVCIQFLTDITNDILRKNIYTNTALRGVLQQHIKRNKYDLQMEIMHFETMKLQERLGIPKDEKFDDEDFGLGGLNLIIIDDIKKVEYQSIGSTSTLLTLPLPVPEPETDDDFIIKDPTVLTSPKTENDLISRCTNLSSDTRDTREEEDQSQNADYSDNFSEENSYSESSRSKREACDRSISSKSSVEIKDDEASSEIEEDVEQVDNKSEKYSDIDESISHLEPDSSEISEG